jgi:hypothetical protein
MKLVEIDAAAILGYVAYRRRQGQAAATINVDLGTLRKALRLAQEYGKLATVSRIKMLKPAPPRQGFFERDQFESVKAALPVDLALVMTIAFLYGWRVPSEGLTLTKAPKVDLEAGTLRLEPGSTKSQEGRLVVPDTGAKGGPG